MKAALDKLITIGIFPLTFGAAMLTSYYLAQQGVPVEFALGGVTLTAMFIIAVFERIHPHVLSWNQSQDDVGTDFVHLLISQIALPRLLEVVMAVLFLGLAVKISHWLGHTIWPSHWNIAAQLVLAMVISQFGEYWVHRSLHTVPWLWRFHATHHSPGRLYWLNAARFHPVDTLLLQFVSSLPLLLLGTGETVLLLTLTWSAVHGLFQHSNIRMKLGPLNYIFSMAELHRWHHSLDVKEANNNYGNNIILYDIIFGTMYYPKDKEASANIGLSNLDNFPKKYWGQIMSPFRWEKTAARPYAD